MGCQSLSSQSRCAFPTCQEPRGQGPGIGAGVPEEADVGHEGHDGCWKPQSGSITSCDGHVVHFSRSVPSGMAIQTLPLEVAPLPWPRKTQGSHMAGNVRPQAPNRQLKHCPSG